MKNLKSYALVSPAFTMIELIFVIVIVGILAGAATMAMPDNKLYSDTNFIVQKIKQTQMNALYHDHFRFDDATWRSGDYNDTCIEISKPYLATLEKNSNSPQKYQLSAQTSISVSASKLCFDNLARPYKNDYQLNNFLKTPIELNITYKQKIKRLFIMPYSGSVQKIN